MTLIKSAQHDVVIGTTSHRTFSHLNILINTVTLNLWVMIIKYYVKHVEMEA